MSGYGGLVLERQGHAGDLGARPGLIWAIRQLDAWLLALVVRLHAGRRDEQPGSPAGVGYGRNPKIFMKPGDVVTATVDEVGTLSNPVRAAG